MPEQRTKWEEDNEASLNPWAIFATAVAFLFLAGLAVLFALT